MVTINHFLIICQNFFYLSRKQRLNALKINILKHKKREKKNQNEEFYFYFEDKKLKKQIEKRIIRPQFKNLIRETKSEALKNQLSLYIPKHIHN